MIIKSTIYEILNKYLGEYLYGFEKEQLDFALISGELELINVNFKPSRVNEKLLQNGLPFNMKSGMIGKLKIKYNFRNWLSNPVEVSINELLIIFGPILVNNSEAFNKPFENFVTENSEESPPVSGQSSPTKAYGTSPNLSKTEGFIEKYLKNILINLTLIIENVHIRYEDETFPYKHPFSLTILFDSLLIKTSSSEWYLDDKAEIRRRLARKNSTVKEGKIRGFSINLVSMSEMLIPNSLWEATISSEIGIFEAIAAYEIRDLLRVESQNLKKDDNSLLLYPLNVDFMITLSQENPTLKVSVLCDKVFMKLSSNMSECLRNFNEYYSNVSIWKAIRKYRPNERIPTFLGGSFSNEQQKSDIIKQWYLYAFRFIKAKLQLKNPKKYANEVQNEEENEAIKAEEYEELKEEVLDVESNFERMQTRSFSEKLPGEAAHPRNSIFMSKNRKTPGISDNSLSIIVKEYNDRLSLSDILAIKAAVKPLPQPVKYFPKFIENSEIDFKVKDICILLFDEEIRLKLEASVDVLYIKNRIAYDTANSFVSIDHFESIVQEGNIASKIIDLGKVLFDSPHSSPNKNKLTEKYDRAVELLFIYNPSQKKSAEGELPKRNLLEIAGKFAQINLEYSTQILSRLLTIFDAFRIDKISRDYLDEDYMKRIERKRTSLTVKEKFIKKQRQVIHGSIFKKLFLTKKLIKRILQWQGTLKESLKNADKKIKSILFDIKIEAGGIKFKIADKSNQICSEIFSPSGIFEFRKLNDLTHFSFWGFGFETREPLKSFYSYLLEASKINSIRKKRRKTVTKRT